MPFSRFVETGRVAYISGGPYAGRLATIVDVIDQTRVLVDGPQTKVPRTAVRLNQLRLTKFLLNFPYRSTSHIVKQKWDEAKISEQWKNSSWAKKAAAKRLRRNMSDLDRFKLRHARRIRNTVRSVVYHKLRKADNKLRVKVKQENKGKKGYGRRPKAGKAKAKK